MVATHMKRYFLYLILLSQHLLDFISKNKVNFEFQKKLKLITFKKSTALHYDLDLSPKSHGHILLPMFDFEYTCQNQFSKTNGL